MIGREGKDLDSVGDWMALEKGLRLGVLESGMESGVVLVG